MCAAFRPYLDDDSCVYETFDAGASPGTAYNLNVGGMYVGEISNADDSDWIAIALVEGQTYNFSIFGETAASASLQLLDSDGSALSAADGVHASTVLNRALSFTADQDGTFYVAASSEDVGSYWISVEETVPEELSANEEDGSIYLNISNMDVRLGESMAAEPFVNVNTENSLRNIIDAASADATEVHTQATHVWINSQDLRLEFDFRVEYSLDILHFWNYHTEEYDVDRIVFKFYDGERNFISRETLNPVSGTGNTQTSQDVALVLNGPVRYVDVVLSGSNGEVDFNNLGFTGRLACEPIQHGTAGDDVFFACDGAVSYRMGRNTREGGDALIYRLSDEAVIVDLEANIGRSGFAEGDRYHSVEIVVGSRFDDKLIGDSDNNTFEGHRGADRLIGGLGNDTAIYESSNGRVTVNLDTGRGLSGHAEGDRLRSIENVIGTSFDDVLFGNDKVNTLKGGDGDDLLRGGKKGDTLVGGKGIDTADYRTSGAGVVINLERDLASGGHANGDELNSIEDIIGSKFADTLIGDDRDNILKGGQGKDVLRGGKGQDLLDGGAGADTFAFAPGDTNQGRDTIRGFDARDGVGAGVRTSDRINLVAFNLDGIEDLKIRGVGDDVFIDAVDFPLAIRITGLVGTLEASDFVF